MKTSDLIKQAEELLAKHGNPFTVFEFSKFIRDHLQELLDRLKRYEEALQSISKFYVNNDGQCGGFAVEVAMKALCEICLI